MVREKEKRKSRMKSFKYVQLCIKRLCSELFYYGMPQSEYFCTYAIVKDWIRCENAIGRIDNDYVLASLDYAYDVSRNIVDGK